MTLVREVEVASSPAQAPSRCIIAGNARVALATHRSRHG
jgi:hypothetical protein